MLWICASLEFSEVELELVALREDESVATSVRVEDTRAPIFESILVRHSIIVFVSIVVLN